MMLDERIASRFARIGLGHVTKQYPYKDVHPFGRMVYDAFGPRRLLFGTGMVGATRRIPLAVKVICDRPPQQLRFPLAQRSGITSIAECRVRR